MNIFALSMHPVECAEFYCDKHINKMTLESAQMLSTAAHLRCGPHLLKTKYENKIYKPAYINHPCTQWAAETMSNALWLYSLVIAMKAEKLRRSEGGACLIHKSARVAQHAIEAITEHSIVKLNPNLTPFAEAFAAEFLLAQTENFHYLSTIEKYRQYYVWKANHKFKMTWGKNNKFIPSWIMSEIHMQMNPISKSAMF